jgi:hypothetical protein
LEVNPFFWRVAREKWRGYAVWCCMGGVGLVWLWGATKYGDDWIGTPSYVITALVLTLGLKMGVATEAGYAFCEDRRGGALELVLATPLTVSEIVRGQLLALKRQFLAAGCVTLGLCFLFLLLTLSDSRSGLAEDERTGMITAWVAAMLLFVADCAALAVVGMWQGLIQRHPSRAGSTTVAWVLGPPWLVFLLVTLWVALNHTSPPDWWFYLGLWVVPSLVVDVGLGLVAWRKLHADFRQVVMERHAARTSWWRRTSSGG